MSARRRARAAAPDQVSTAGSLEDLLRDPEASVWHAADEYAALIAAHGWSLPLSHQWRDIHPANRRARAADLWAADSGIGRDWHKLRQLGFIS